MNAWSARFGALGVKLSAALSALCTNQDDIEAVEEPLRALALLLEKAPVAEDQLCMLTDMQLSQVAKLCLSAGVIEPQAAAEVRNLTKNPSGDGRARLRCALALCRVPDPGARLLRLTNTATKRHLSVCRRAIARISPPPPRRFVVAWSRDSA
ncbi:MAG: hypothetical protein V8T51_02340 [Senegalimassilia faecalis]